MIIGVIRGVITKEVAGSTKTMDYMELDMELDMHLDKDNKIENK